MNKLISKIRSFFQKTKFSDHHATHIKANRSAIQKTYFFTHVPKTGGTTLIATLDRFFPQERIFPHQLWWEVGDIEQVRKDNFEFFRGHFGGGAANLLTDKDVEFFTVLRNPIKLAYSTYQHVLRDKHTQVHNLVVKEKMNFESFLSHPKTSHLASNRIVHNFCYGENNQIDKQNTIINDKSFKFIRKQLNPLHNGLTEDACFQKALNFLEASKWFGILEYFNESLDLLCYTMVWPPVGQTVKLNQNKNPQNITDEAIKKATEINVYDFQLYEYALKVFKEKYHSMLKSLGANKNHHNVSELIDQYYQNNYLTAHQIDLQNEIEYTVADVILGSQWHRREWSADHHCYFCWSGPESKSFLDFWLKPNHYVIRITLINTVSKNFMDSLKIKINDQFIHWHHHKIADCDEITINCDESLVKTNGLVRIQFEGPTHKLATGLLRSEDDRLVGFALSRVTIKPVND